jgi:1-deoxy-D-xylulose-5-phosphate reductoisomerase
MQKSGLMTLRCTASTPLPSPAPRRVTILGATGSIGTSALDILTHHPQHFSVAALTAQENVEKLIALAHQFRPEIVAIGNETHYQTLKSALVGRNIQILAGAQGVIEAARIPADVTVAAIVGAAGLPAVMAAMAQGNSVALANKESLVCAGTLVMEACRRYGTQLLPVDSEHNAVFQILTSAHQAAVERITLTASGGPFLTRPIVEFQHITPAEAVAHPRWQMGAKISVDSATMMNKGLELIEAHFLFGLPAEKIDVVIHPESIIHALVDYHDGSVLAQLGMPDMRIPLSYALGFPERLAIPTRRLDLPVIAALHFSAVDDARFPAYGLARRALAAGQAAMITLNAANEVAVQAFLDGKIPFPAIVHSVESALADSGVTAMSDLDSVMALDAEMRRKTAERIGAC